jgi:hypothetical protein
MEPDKGNVGDDVHSERNVVERDEEEVSCDNIKLIG